MRYIINYDDLNSRSALSRFARNMLRDCCNEHLAHTRQYAGFTVDDIEGKLVVTFWLEDEDTNVRGIEQVLTLHEPAHVVHAVAFANS
jgi:hypothetical protein